MKENGCGRHIKNLAPQPEYIMNVDCLAGVQILFTFYANGG